MDTHPLPLPSGPLPTHPPPFASHYTPLHLFEITLHNNQINSISRPKSLTHNPSPLAINSFINLDWLDDLAITQLCDPLFQGRLRGWVKYRICFTSSRWGELVGLRGWVVWRTSVRGDGRGVARGVRGWWGALRSVQQVQPAPPTQPLPLMQGERSTVLENSVRPPPSPTREEVREYFRSQVSYLANLGTKLREGTLLQPMAGESALRINTTYCNADLVYPAPCTSPFPKSPPQDNGSVEVWSWLRDVDYEESVRRPQSLRVPIPVRSGSSVRVKAGGDVGPRFKKWPWGPMEMSDEGWIICPP